MSVFYTDPATTEIYTLSLHAALPIFPSRAIPDLMPTTGAVRHDPPVRRRSEEHTSELQSQSHLVCSLFLSNNKCLFFIQIRRPPRSTLSPYTPLFPSSRPAPSLI